MTIPIFPILLFLTALFNLFLYLRTANDIFAVLAAGMTICCLIWGLIIAHWSIHLLALLALLFCGRSKAIARVGSSPVATVAVGSKTR